MDCSVVMETTPEGQYPTELMEFDLIGTVQKQGSVEYGFDGMIGYHHNVVDYFRASADTGKITVVVNAVRPLAAAALYKLFTLRGRKVGKVVVMAKRADGTSRASLELDGVTIVSVSPVGVSSGTVYLVAFQAAKGNVNNGFGARRMRAA